MIRYNDNDEYSSSTSCTLSSDNTKIVNVKIGNYDVKVLLSLDNKFIDVVEIGINKEFYQKKVPSQFHEIDDYYKD